MNKSRIIALISALVLLISLFAGCADDNGNTTTATVSGSQSGGESIFPLADAVSFDVYIGIVPDIGIYVSDPAVDMTVYRELQERLNVNFNFTVSSDEVTGFQLLIASRDYGDLLPSITTNYTGGAEMAVDDEVIIDLASYTEYMPNYYSNVLSDEDLYRDIATEKGYIPRFAMVYATNYGIMSGSSIRSDWLADLNLDFPETYEDWYEALKLFKTEKGADFALALNGTGVALSENISSGLGVRLQYTTDTMNSSPWYTVGGKNGTVKFGPIENGALDYLTMINQWYKEGLINEDFINYTRGQTPEESIMNGEVGIAFANPNKMLSWSLQSEDPNMVWTPISDPTKDGVGTEYINHNKSRVKDQGFSITTQCENKEIAVAMLDYGYSDEGYVLWNYGVLNEGLEYDENGDPQFTDLILKNPDGLDSTVAATIYATSTYGSFITDMNRFNRYYTAEQAIAIPTWNAVNENSDNWSYPSTAYMTTEESEQYEQLMADIFTFISENFLAFVVGNKPLDEFDAYVAAVKEMGIDEAISLKQAALDRYMQK